MTWNAICSFFATIWPTFVYLAKLWPTIQKAIREVRGEAKRLKYDKEQQSVCVDGLLCDHLHCKIEEATAQKQETESAT